MSDLPPRKRERAFLRTLLWLSVHHRGSAPKWLPAAANDDFDWIVA